MSASRETESAPLGVQWHMTKIEKADEFGCFDGEEHWDVWYWHSEVETIRSEPGIFEGKLLPPSEANVCCILGDEATVRHLVDLHNAAVSSAPPERTPV